MFGDDRHAPLSWDLVLAHELRVLGAHGMAARDYPQMLDMIASGRLEPRRLLGSVIALDRAGAALMAMDEPVPAQPGFTVATI